MSSEPVAATPRSTAGERRRQLIEAAVPAFAAKGLHGTAVSEVTDRVGVTQPYAFSLFGTKKGLFLAALGHMHDHIETTFRAAADGLEREAALEAMGEAYVALLQDRDWLLLQLHGYAACSDEQVRSCMRERWVRLGALVRELTDADDLQLRTFLADGMLLNTAAALDLPMLAEQGCGWLDAPEG
jgi:AcrR family transcriptional regulator